MLSVGGTEIVFPEKSYQVILSDIDGDSNRNANGEMIRDRIAVKRKLELEWQPLSQSEIASLLNAVSDVFFSVTFIDPKDGSITKTMYVGDRTAPSYRYDSTSGEMKWSGLKMNFIEK